MMFAAISDAKMCAGYVLDYLAQAIAFSNHQYFRKSQTDQIEELTDMKKVPKRFFELYRNVIDESDVEVQRKLSRSQRTYGVRRPSTVRLPSLLLSTAVYSDAPATGANE